MTKNDLRIATALILFGWVAGLHGVVEIRRHSLTKRTNDAD